MFPVVLDEVQPGTCHMFQFALFKCSHRLMVQPNMNTELVCESKSFMEVGTNCVLLVLHFHTFLSYIPYLHGV